MRKYTGFTIISILVLTIGYIIYRSFDPVSGTFEVGDPLVNNENQITAIELINNGTIIRIEKSDTLWKMVLPVEDAADADKMESTLKLITETKMLSPISNNPQKQTTFGVDSSGNLLKVFKGEQKYAFVVGKLGPDFRSTYVRPEGKNDVFLYGGILSTVFAPSTQYRDRTLLDIERKALTQVHIKSQNMETHLVKDSTGWILDGQKVKTDVVGNLESSISALKADAIVDTLTVDQLTQTPELSLMVNNNSVFLVNFFKIPEQVDYLATKTGTNKVYRVSGYKVDRINKPKSYWLE